VRRFHPAIEQLESRTLSTLVFVLNGNAFAQAKPNQMQTLLAAQQLMEHGDRAVQLTTPALTDPSVFYRVANQIFAISKGQPIGLMGFSAGGCLAMRLSAIAMLNVKAVLSYYGPPDLRDWLNYHRGDRDYAFVTSHVHFDRGIINVLSGPSTSTAFIVSAFGLKDHNIVSSISTASFDRDFQFGQVFYYPGPHGVTLFADYAAFKDFLSHLSS
jgi:hypothetical protein